MSTSYLAIFLLLRAEAVDLPLVSISINSLSSLGVLSDLEELAQVKGLECLGSVTGDEFGVRVGRAGDRVSAGARGDGDETTVASSSIAGASLRWGEEPFLDKVQEPKP